MSGGKEGMPAEMGARQWSSLFVLLLISAALMLGGVVMLGLPGGVMVTLTAPLVEPVLGLAPGSIGASEGAWPLALSTTILFPAGIPLSYWLSRRLWPDTGRVQRTIAVLAGTWLWSALVVLGLVAAG